MLLPGTEMHVATFVFVCLEVLIIFYLIIHRLARPDIRSTFLNIILVALLIAYNITGGLLPDPRLPGSFFIQECLAYATGFLTPCYFPYYVYKAFGLEKMKYHACRGVYLFLVLPYLLFVLVFAASGSLEAAKEVLIAPVLYALWVLYSVGSAIKFKYQDGFRTRASKEEVAVLFLSLAPWVGLPLVAYYDLSQAVEVTATNSGFLLLLALQVKRNIRQMKMEYQRLVASERRLVNWNKILEQEVEKRTRELRQSNEQKTNILVNLAHETRTPLTLIGNYLDDYIAAHGNSVELEIMKKSVDKLTADILNLFDLERIEKGLAIYNHNQVSDFSAILKEHLALFGQYAVRHKMVIRAQIEDALFIKADPVSLNRIVNNLVENAIKFSDKGGLIELVLKAAGEKIHLRVKDQGMGIPVPVQQKVFEPYYQIARRKSGIQEGMGLGLPLVKKVVEGLGGAIYLESTPGKGSQVDVVLPRHLPENKETAGGGVSRLPDLVLPEERSLNVQPFRENSQSILVVEDNVAMINYLSCKLGQHYNVYAALNGHEALRRLKSLEVLPELIISDVMMDKVDGFGFAKIISRDPRYRHIPFIFLTARSGKTARLEGLRLGAMDYIQKPFSVQELLGKVESILAMLSRQKRSLLPAVSSVFSPVASEPMWDGAGRFEQNCASYQLTSREKEIVRLIVQGYTYKKIGETLFIAERTVAKHVQNIFEKVDVSNKIELCKKLEG